MSSVLRKFRGEDVFDQPVPATYKNHHVLAASTAETETVPATIGSSVVPKVVLIIPTETIFIRTDGTAAVPSADVSGGTALTMVRGGDSLLLPVTPADALSIISESACHVSFWYYGI